MRKLLTLLLCLALLAQAGVAVFAEGLMIEEELPPVETEGGAEAVDAPVNETEAVLGAEARESDPGKDKAEVLANASTRIDGTTLLRYWADNNESGDIVILPSSLTTIGVGAFCEGDHMLEPWRSNKNIVSISLPSSIIRIEERAFKWCGNNHGYTINLPSSIIYIGPRAFQESGLKSVSIPTSIATIENYTFYSCGRLTSATIPSSVARIGASAFEDCTALPGITIPSSVYIIDDRAFSNCAALTGIVIPEGVMTLGARAFQRCSILSTAKLPSTLTGMGVYAFDQCISLTGVEVPAGITLIPEGAFSNCSSLAKATISNNTESIGDFAFYNNSRLKSLNADGSIVLPDGLKSIGSCAFAKDSAITEVIIGSDIETIGDDAFDNCTLLSHVVIKGHGNIGGEGAFDSISPRATFRMSCDLNLVQPMKDRGYLVIPEHDNMVIDERVEPTCTEDGLTQGYHCADCGYVELPQEIIPATGHTVVIDPAVKPTFKTPGKTEGSHCSVCGEILVEQEEIPPLSGAVTLSVTGTKDLTIGKTLQLKATVNPPEVKSYLTWKSSKPSIASVTGKGKVKALKKGKTVISAKLPDGSGASVTIHVVAPKPTKIEITNGKSATLKVGKQLKLKTKLTPSNAESKLTWKSSKTSVATVSKSGVVTAKKAGTAKITVTTENKKKASITIRVIKK